MSDKPKPAASKAAPAKGKKAAAVSSSSSSSSSSEDEAPRKKTAAPAAAAPKAKPAAAKKPQSSSSSSSSSGSDSSSDDDDEPKSKGGKKLTAKEAAAAKKKKQAAISSSDDSDDEDDKKKKKKPAAKAAPVPSKKPAEKKPVANAFAGLSGDDDDDAASESESASESEEEEVKPKKPAAAAPAAAAKVAKKAAPAAAAAASPADDLDSILNDLEITPGGGGGAGHPTDESKMTKAQLKRLRQKQKQEAEKNAPADAAAAAPAAAAAAAAPAAAAKPKKEEAAKPAGKSSKAVEALKERLRIQKEEDDRRKKEEEDRIAAIEAERIKLEEEARLAAEEKERKTQARIKKREEDRKAGVLLSKTEKAALAKRQAFLKQLEASGTALPAALQAEKKAGEAAAAAAAVSADGASPEASPTAAADGVDKKKDGKKDQHKKKSAFGKRLEAQKEADRIRAERHAAEDVSRIAHKEEEERRKKEDAAFAAKIAATQAALDDEERALDVESPAEVVSEEEEAVADSWEELDSEEERRKTTEKEQRRTARFAAKQKRAADKQAALVALAKKREDVAKAHEQEAAEIKKRRQVLDEQRRKKAEEAVKAQQESDRQAQAVAAGFELESDHKPAEESSAAAVAVSSASGGKADKRKGDLRSPIACILGHVDTGKTKILDKIRSTSVQAHEAGGITQQIGATFMPRANILEKTAELSKFLGKDLKMETPGLLVIDTPGHESFTNLRSRGSNLCDIAILVIDIMHGLEPQTIESINLLKQRKTPFVIALNKIDRCYGWKTHPNAPFQVTYNAQSDSTQAEFQKRTAEAIVLMAQQGLNCIEYYKNTDFRKWISIVPTSAITGEGIPDLLMLLVQLTQNMMNERLSYVSELACTVLEVKVVEGLGTTIDVILVNGILQEGDTIVVCGLNGPIVTTIRALLTPPPMHEIRVKLFTAHAERVHVANSAEQADNLSDYVHHKMVKAAMGVKISAQGLDNAVAGSSLMVCKKNDDIEELKDEVQGDLATILSKVDKSGQGVAVQASTLGSLEALLTFLGEMKIPVSSISIGPVYKKDVMKAAVMLEKRPEFGVMLCFDVKVSADAQKIAEEMGVKIFTADIIYHLFDACTKWMAEVKEKKRGDSADVAVFPCVLDILPNAIFNVKSPIVLGVRVVEGVARVGTPICIPSKNFLVIGRITGIQKNHTDFQEAKKGEEFACKIEQSKSDQQIVFGRHFDATCQLVSKLTRESIDLLKANFKDDLSEADWRLVVKLKKVFDIV